jgi:hypothetical protein
VVKDLSVRPETLKPLKKNTGKILHYIGIGNAFLNITPIAEEVSVRTKKWDLSNCKASVQQSK